jgi:hypothetical protein
MDFGLVASCQFQSSSILNVLQLQLSIWSTILSGIEV